MNQMNKKTQKSTLLKMDVTPERWRECAANAECFGEFMRRVPELKPTSVVAEVDRLYLEFHAVHLVRKHMGEQGAESMLPLDLNRVTEAVRAEVADLLAAVLA